MWMLIRLLPILAAGCFSRFEVKATTTTPLDAIIVPGCPSEEGGRLSRCQMARALAAAKLWRAGAARHFITSGGAVHSPYVEADAIAAAMVAVGVPGERIHLEPNALHTDENMYYSLQIAQQRGWSRLGVVSSLGHAAWGCHMLEDWGVRGCKAFGFDVTEVKALHESLGQPLDRLRTPAVTPWVPMAERERRRAERFGRRRPPSALLYPYLAWLRLTGEGPWVPPWGPVTVPTATWADRTAPAPAPQVPTDGGGVGQRGVAISPRAP